MYGLARTANLLGAAALTITDRLLTVATQVAGTGAGGASALVTLTTRPGIGVTELGAQVGVSQPQAARLVAGLAARGLLERRPGRDGRSVALYLTERGADTARQVLAARERELARLVDHLDAEERAALERGLEKLLDRVYDDIGSPWVICRLCDEAACLAAGATCPVGQAWRERGR